MDQASKLMISLPKDLDAVWITSPQNRLYFTGFSSSDGILLLTRNTFYFLVDFRYLEAAKRIIRDMKIVKLTEEHAQLSEIFRQMNLRHVAVEADQMTISGLNRLQEKYPRAEFVADGRVDEQINRLRMCKTPYELDCIRTAQKITDAAFANLLDYIHIGRTEREIAARLEYELKLLGSDGLAFSTICVSGANSSLPHGVPGGRTLQEGDFLTLDFGARFKGYCAEMTRTVAIGEISEEQRRVYDTVLHAQLAALKAIRPGVECRKIDAVARDIIAAAGYAENFGHGLGHSLGVEIQEDPRYNQTCETLTEPGMVITVEPGIYLENCFGVRIEDMALITREGYENLTHSPKELITLR